MTKKRKRTSNAGVPTEGRITLRVTPNSDRWKLTLTPGGLVLLDRAKTQRHAKRLARTIAKAIAAEGCPTQVVWHEADGTIGGEWSFPRSSDPSPPKG